MSETEIILAVIAILLLLGVIKLVCRIIKKVVSVIRKAHDNILMNTVTDKSRGTRSERSLVVDLLKYGIPSEDIYHGLYLEYAPGRYSQIDVVAVVPAGLIVFEEKDYSGWIFGKGWQNQWTQVLNYGKEKVHFYNPIKQNESHINWLRSLICDKEGKSPRVISFIVFHGNCVFRRVSEIPDDVILTYAYEFEEGMGRVESLPKEDFDDIERVRRVLRQGVRNGKDPEVIAQHKKYVSQCRIENLL